jgi:decaprenyl-phosphate phosphoribosyltransferase
MLPYLQLIRPKHWSKNLFIFIPAFFSGHAFDLKLYPSLLLGVLSFCMIASAVYILNDFNDRETDRQHPTKKTRPLASGEANVIVSLIFMVALACGALWISWNLNTSYFLLLVTYFFINIAYTLHLKNIPILDIFIVASGFLFRIYSGGILANVYVSHWLAIMVFLLSLFLALAKRRDDLVIRENNQIIRKSSRNYNLEFINACLSAFTGIITVAYIMYTISPEVTDRLGTNWLFATTIFVVAGLMRYLQITFVEEKSGSPTTVLYRDKFILTTLIGWVISFYLIIYT